MDKQPFTVLLLRPDYMAEEFGKDTFLTHVDATGRQDAIEAAQIDAHKFDGLGEDGEPEDYAALLVLHGHHNAVPEGAGNNDAAG